jgi:hypothetical protein
MWRPWIKEGGGLLAADSPRLSFQMHELFARAELPPLVADYLGEPPLISAHKTTLRKAEPSVSGAWHQDGKFMGPVRSLNLWRFQGAGTRRRDWASFPGGCPTTSQPARWGPSSTGRSRSGRAGRPPRGSPWPGRSSRPGDGLLFDELFLHKTGSDPSMPNPRFAIENWIFGASAFPADYAPIAV